MRRGGDLIGYALVAVEPDGDVLWSDTWQVGDKVAELETMYLVPEERGQGLGGLLLDMVDAELEARGIRRPRDRRGAGQHGRAEALRAQGLPPGVDDRDPVRGADQAGSRRLPLEPVGEPTHAKRRQPPAAGEPGQLLAVGRRAGAALRQAMPGRPGVPGRAADGPALACDTVTRSRPADSVRGRPAATQPASETTSA